MKESPTTSSDYLQGRQLSRELAEAHVAEQQDSARRDRIARLYGHAGLPERFRGRTLQDLEQYDPAIERAVHVCQRYADNFDQVSAFGTCLSLVGRPGTGKTHAATAVLEALVDAGHSGLYLTLADLLRAFRASYSNQGQTEEAVLRYFVEPDLLVLDEIGFALGNLEKTRATLFDVFDRRYRDFKPTIVVGNLTPQELKDYLGERIFRRIQENGGTVLAFDWTPYAERDQ